ncbi:3-dehydroquinate synthase II [Streptomyces sp. H27-D2]|uniref:3-dehydroquinate synthase II n=1 Tax=Streptomyces sp. H27-D2 TaxID=3046304 RepID=UPI002DB92986|nr:3-dehydroquinate synthase II [Streptomyces sp. H27-D2]MEC4015032.1 3-dehydroquinate synthase II [Streptomyces sp. H27-D2]
MTMTELWVDVSTLTPAETPDTLAYLRSSSATVLVLRHDQYVDWQPIDRLRTACLVGAEEADVAEQISADERVDMIIARSPADIDLARQVVGSRPLVVRCEIVDGDTMNEAADLSGKVDVVVAAFSDETNIPLELLLAKAQSTKTGIVKQLLNTAEASTVAGVLESGPAGLMVSAERLSDVELVTSVVAAQRKVHKDLVQLEVIRAEPVGMGYRGCIDTTTLFGEDEGMIIGSTSSGGILVCAEVHYLPYMNLRPFRVNAGAVHSYVFGAQDTAYITDLRAGEQSHAVAADGQFREVGIGRVKVEMRPLRLIEARYGDVTVNVILQDDWHVRVMGGDGKAKNLTDVTPGSTLLGMITEPGRHVGIKVSEYIDEY